MAGTTPGWPQGRPVRRKVRAWTAGEAVLEVHLGAGSMFGFGFSFVFRRPAAAGPGRLSRLAALVVLLLAASAAPAISAQDLTGLFLTWQSDPTTTMTINWVNLYPRNTEKVFHRQAGTTDWMESRAVQSEVAPSALQLRRVELQGLLPDTTYEFGIGSAPDKPEKGWRFRTMPERLTRPVRFVTGGDMMHDRARVDRMNEVAKKLDPDFALLGGDLAYANGVSAMRWVDWLQSWMTRCMTAERRLIPIVPAIGNHEVRGGYNGKIPDDAPYYYGLFVPPGRNSYHVVDFGKYLSLVVLDSGHTQPVAGPQREWLAQTLAARSEQAFLFACYHYPAYGTTKAPENGTPLDAPQAIAIREHWVPLLEQFGVSAVFENDHHNFKRTHRIRRHQRDDQNGLLYLGDGAWGVETRTVPKEGEAWWLAKAEARNHLWLVELGSDQSARIRAIDVEGVVFDEVRLERPRTVPEHGLAVPQSAGPSNGF